MSLAYSVGKSTISLYYNGEYFQVDQTHPNYAAVLEELRKPDRDNAVVVELAQLPKFVATLTSGRVEVGPLGVRFRGEEVGGYMVERLLTMLDNPDHLSSWAAFMDNMMDNPNAEVREDLYKWMEVGGMPITPDGCIIAFKKVRQNYTDVHTGKFDNSVGAVLSMDRSLCDPSRHNTCSTGFHFCSAGYLSSFGGDRVMVVKINPRDVTAIPKDYNLTKARCCQYTVTGELTQQSAARHKVWSDRTVVDLEDPQELPEVMLPRAATPGRVEADPARTSGPPPIDDLANPKKKTATKKKAAAAPPAASPPAKKRPPAKKKTAPAEPPVKKAGAKKKVAPAEPVVKNTASKKTKPATLAPTAVPQEPVGLRFARGAQQFTSQQITEAYSANGKSKSATAKALGVPKSTLHGWLAKLGL